MSVITTAFDDIETRLDGLFSSTHRRLVNPYQPELNDTKALNRGWGFFIGPGTNTNRKLGCKLSIQREVTVLHTIINRGTERDITIRETAEKLLLEDQFLAIKNFEQNPVVNNDVPKFVYSADNGIEYIFTEQTNFIMIRSTFIMEYFEAF